MPMFHEGLEALRKKYGPFNGWTWGGIAAGGVAVYVLFFKKKGGALGAANSVPVANSVYSAPPEITNGPGGPGGGGVTTPPPSAPPTVAPAPPTITTPIDTFIPTTTAGPHAGGPININPQYSEPGSLTPSQTQSLGEYTQYVAKINALPQTNDLDVASLQALQASRQQFGSGGRASVDNLNNVPIDDAIAYLQNKIAGGHPPAVGSAGSYGSAASTQAASNTGQLVH